MAQFYKLEKRGKIELAQAPNPVKVITDDGSTVDWHIHYGWTSITKSEYDKIQVNGYAEYIKPKLQESIDNDPDSFRWNYGDIMNTLPPLTIGDEDLQAVIEKMLPMASFNQSEKKPTQKR